MLLATKRRSDEATKGSRTVKEGTAHRGRAMPPASRLTSHASYRGSTLVLVVGILALLVIIATTYVTRTHGGRVVGVAIQRSQQRENNARVIGDMLAQEIVDALFVRPVNPANPFDSNEPRVAFDVDGNGFIDFDEIPYRYGVDPTDFQDTAGFPVPDGFPDYPFNFAPYHVVPFTNWTTRPCSSFVRESWRTMVIRIADGQGVKATPVAGVQGTPVVGSRGSSRL